MGVYSWKNEEIFRDVRLLAQKCLKLEFSIWVLVSRGPTYLIIKSLMFLMAIHANSNVLGPSYPSIHLLI